MFSCMAGGLLWASARLRALIAGQVSVGIYLDPQKVTRSN
jgi:hypothetical protein